MRTSYDFHHSRLMIPSIANPGHLNIGIDWDSESSIQNLYYLECIFSPCVRLKVVFLDIRTKMSNEVESRLFILSIEEPCSMSPTRQSRYGA